MRWDTRAAIAGTGSIGYSAICGPFLRGKPKRAPIERFRSYVDKKVAEATRPPKRSDLLRLCAELNKLRAQYIVIGGLAMNELGLAISGK